MKHKFKFIFLMLIVLTLVLGLIGCGNKTTDYSDLSNWAYFEVDKDKPVDVFFISPTSVYNQDEVYIAYVNEENNASNLNSINMEKGLYDDNARFFAPYYTQITIAAYTLPEEERLAYIDECYEDVKAAFLYYMKHVNDGRPFIIAGFSQGAEHALKLVEEYSNNEKFMSQMIATYAIGWHITSETLSKYPNLKMAESSNDTGVIICFECESEDVNGSIIVPEGIKTLGINPLTWTTTTSYVLSDYNLGACFTDYDGNITSEIPNFCGARLDSIRGTVKVTDINKEDYPEGLYVFTPGCYHIYDYIFFYRNIEINVLERINVYLKNNN